MTFRTRQCFWPDLIPQAINRKSTPRPHLSNRTTLSTDQVCLLLELCLNSTYFTYDGQYYKENYGCTMASPVSPIAVNLLMVSEKESSAVLHWNTIKSLVQASICSLLLILFRVLGGLEPIPVRSRGRVYPRLVASLSQG